MDEKFHFPPDVFNLLVDTNHLLLKGKDDVLNCLRGAGVPGEDLAETVAQEKVDRKSIGKYAIVRDVLEKLNGRGEAGLAARRELTRRVFKCEAISMCCEKDVCNAEAKVGARYVRISFAECLDKPFSNLTDVVEGRND
jgi:hypothetical protein